jgi:hypothetical protein
MIENETGAVHVEPGALKGDARQTAEKSRRLATSTRTCNTFNDSKFSATGRTDCGVLL